MKNKLFYGDNLTVMKEKIPSSSIDLIYLDPPFNSARDYNAIFEIETGLKLPEQVAAFKDTWEYNLESEKAFNRTILKMAKIFGDNDVKFWQNYMQALKSSNEKLLAYLIYMTERLLEMKGLLKSTGSIYLHCDPTASHYLKIIMDIIFGHKNFRNEIIWCYKENDTATKYFPRKHDVILFYSKSNKYTFNVQRGEITKAQQARYNHIIDGERYANMKGKMRKLEGGAKFRDWWELPIVQANERVGYPTQKPLALLERIIKASSNEGDVVLDPFCGCATTIDAAHRLKRKWLGIDITIFAINRVSQKRLAKSPLGLKASVDYEIQGIPNSMASARALWQRDSYHFQKWAIESIEGYVNPKKTSDGGVDGRLFFKKSHSELGSMILEVKGGKGKNVNTDVVIKLIDALKTRGGEMAGLIHLEPLSEKMKKNLASRIAKEGFVKIEGKEYEKIQILSIAEMLKGKNFNTPSVQIDKKMSQKEIFA